VYPYVRGISSTRRIASELSFSGTRQCRCCVRMKDKITTSRAADIFWKLSFAVVRGVQRSNASPLLYQPSPTRCSTRLSRSIWRDNWIIIMMMTMFCKKNFGLSKCVSTARYDFIIIINTRRQRRSDTSYSL